MHRVNQLVQQLTPQSVTSNTRTVNTSARQDYAYESHHSWIAGQPPSSTKTSLPSQEQDETVESVLPLLKSLRDKNNNRVSKYASYYQNDSVPVYDARKLDFNSKNVQNDMYDQFFNRCGAIIVSNGFLKSTMNEYNRWCENFLEIAKNTDANIRHPKQKGKYLINDIMLRLSKDDPQLLFKIINNQSFVKPCDTLLGMFVVY